MPDHESFRYRADPSVRKSPRGGRRNPMCRYLPSWLKFAGLHARVEWQVPHSAGGGMWFAPLPMAVVPLWQELQVPVT